MEEYMQIHIFLNSELVGDQWSVSSSGRFTHQEREPDTHWIGGLVGHGACLNDMEEKNVLTLQTGFY
jgi:hypothetical protein